MTGIIAFALKLFDLVPMIVSGLAGAKEAIEWGVGRIKTMQAEGREPTEEEWAELNSRTQGLREALHTD